MDEATTSLSLLDRLYQAADPTDWVRLVQAYSPLLRWPALTQLLPGYSCWLAGMVLFTLGSTLKLLSAAGNRQKQTGAKGDTALPTSGQTAQVELKGLAERF